MTDKRVLHAGMVKVDDVDIAYTLFYPEEGGDRVDDTEAINEIEELIGEVLCEDVREARNNFHAYPAVFDVFEFEHNGVHLDGKWETVQNTPLTMDKLLEAMVRRLSPHEGELVDYPADERELVHNIIRAILPKGDKEVVEVLASCPELLRHECGPDIETIAQELNRAIFWHMAGMAEEWLNGIGART